MAIIGPCTFFKYFLYQDRKIFCLVKTLRSNMFSQFSRKVQRLKKLLKGMWYLPKEKFSFSGVFSTIFNFSKK